MNNIFFDSDLHFFHDKGFIVNSRGFNSVDEMNEAIVERHNSLVTPDDTVYMLGDMTLGNVEEGIKYIQRMNGHKYLCIGNHDTEQKIKRFKEENIFEDIQFGYRIKLGKNYLLLTHYPTLTGNFNDRQKVFSVHGHTHQQTWNNPDFPTCIHVGLDSNNCYPVSGERIREYIIQTRT